VIGFIDNDIFLKLIAFQLLDETLAALHLSPVKVLPTAKYAFQKSKKFRINHSPETLSAALDLLDNYQTISDHDSEEIQLLTKIDGIDPGEAILIRAVYETPDSIMLSGDKRCLKVLPTIPEFIYQNIQGKVICLEQAILIAIDRLGFQTVFDRIHPIATCDKSIRMCFGYSQPASEQEAIANLQGCVREVEAAASGLMGNFHENL
jgi:hypothetical protein